MMGAGIAAVAGRELRCSYASQEMPGILPLEILP
jgi:hypothetical protein